MRYHIMAFTLGFLLDLLLGDPHSLPHPVRLIGSLIGKTEKFLLGKENKRDEKRELRLGIYLVIIVLAAVISVTALLLFAAHYVNPYTGFALEALMTYQILAVKCLKVESMKVYSCLKNESLEAAKEAVSMIVGRDTAKLDEAGVIMAAVETVAEGTTDAVVSPLLYTALGGPVLGFLYKAVNTMDSMVGYKNDKYLFFGRAAARLDDFMNFLPARIGAHIMIAAAFIAGKDFSGKRAYVIYKKDRKKHPSPNCAQTEAVCAGALGLRLAGDAFYFGNLIKKPVIGDALRPPEYEDIRRANRLMYLTAWICAVLCILNLLFTYMI